MEEFKGKKLEVEIIDTTDDGKAIGRTDDKVIVFVEGGVVGDKVLVDIVKAKKSYLEGKLDKILERSPFRVESKCSASSNCGGCDFQELKYDKQLYLKRKKVIDALSKIGKIETPVEEIIGVENIYNYRNKVVFHIGYDGDKPKIGYYAKETHKVIDIEECNISSDISNKVLKVVKNWLAETNDNGLKHIMVRNSIETGDTMVVLVSRREKVKKLDSLKNNIVSISKDIKTVILNVNEKKGNQILGKQNIPLYGNGFIYDYIEDFKFKISPETFFQVNTEGMKSLYEKSIEYLEIKRNERVLDLYCGIGTITSLMSKKAKVVYGVDQLNKSIKNGKENNLINEVDNVELFSGLAEEVLPKLVSKGKIPDKILVDPPRSGCDKKVLDAISDISPKKLVYISCNPSTLARDLKYLTEKDYIVEKVQPIDLFPMSTHVETITLLRRR